MVKVITFLKRKAGIPVGEFQSYWREKHPEVVTRLPGVRRYVQSHTLVAEYGNGEPLYDGIAEVWADNTDALRAMTRSDDHAAVQADEARFIDRTTMGIVITEDHLVKDGPVPSSAAKGVSFLTRRPGLSIDEFQHHWREVHAPMAALLPGLRRYVQSQTRRSAYEGGRIPAYDGMALTWFDSREAALRAGSTDEFSRVLADASTFLAPGPVRAILTREHVIVA
jgi:uncharacterized protein (TIGR02118 family)